MVVKFSTTKKMESFTTPFIIIRPSMTNPRKIYIETTTRCNLRCDKCIKQIKNNGIIEGDMSFETFEKILPCLSTVDQLILNGIGEPLLHPDLEKMIAAARKAMPKNSSIGFQTNGGLLTAGRARKLIESGISTVCFSLDSLVKTEMNGTCEALPSVSRVSDGLQHLKEAAQQQKRHPSYGLEVVVSSSNIDELPEIVTWALEHCISYMLVSHLFPYDADMAQKNLFSTHSKAALAIFRKWQAKAASLGIDLCPEGKAYLGFAKTSKQKTTLDLLREMRKEASSKDIRLHGETLITFKSEQAQHTQNIFNKAQEIAEAGGIALSLPPLEAQDKRECLFMKDKAVFVSFQGEVMPCYFLWHTYPCMAGTEIIDVHERSFGNILDNNLSDIWREQQYIKFREEAEDGDYAPCWNCTQGPCNDLVVNNILEVDDCYGSHVPCGHCLWSLGGLRCL